MFENFVFDPTGNWLVCERDDNGDQVWDLSQARTHNKANEITCLDSSRANVAHDRNGNMTKMPKPNDWNAAFTCVYDAWNRLVQVKDGNAVTAMYKYNGLNQRIRKTVGTVITQSTFNHNWQELESKTGNAVTTYVWGLRYIDDLICRDKVSERLFALQDANWNVVAITDTNGVVKERIAYNAFGKPTWLSASYGGKTTSGYSWNRTFTGQVFDSETDLMLYRNRFCHPGLGRFVRRDPIGYAASNVNVYAVASNSPNNAVDVFGFATSKTDITWVVETPSMNYTHYYEISFDYIAKCVGEDRTVPYYKRGKITGNYRGYDQQLNDKNWPDFDEVDSAGVSVAVVGIDFTIGYEDDVELTHPKCPKGYKGSIDQIKYTFTVYRYVSVGVYPGIGPWRWTNRLGWGKRTTLATGSTTITVNCCKKCEE